MLLSHKHKLIFVHVGRTGGTSVERVLAPALGLPFTDTYLCSEVVAKRLNVRGPFAHWARERDVGGNYNCKHATARQLKCILGTQIWESYTKFSIVRNPFDRLVSVYHFYQQAAGYSSHPMRDYSTFAEFVGAVRSDSSVAMDANRMSDSILASDGAPLVDVILRYETLQQDFSQFLDRYNFPALQLPRENRSERSRSLLDYYQADDIETITKVYKRDFDNFGYSKELF